jgi:hypothetical protein
MNNDTIYIMAAIIYAQRHSNASPDEAKMRRCYEEAKKLAAVVQQAEQAEGATKQ